MSKEISRKRVADAYSEWPCIRTVDANDRELDESPLQARTCDVVITDPPYGFNTDDNPEELARLYSAVIERMISALKDEGQLVLCLLDRSHTGRRSPFFTHKELITQQVLSIAEQATPKREVIIPAYAVPQQRQIFRAPYYWESERALRRAILHFRIRDRH
jgi:tRNA G10  N-methylase Trm11